MAQGSSTLETGIERSDTPGSRPGISPRPGRGRSTVIPTSEELRFTPNFVTPLRAVKSGYPRSYYY